MGSATPYVSHDPEAATLGVAARTEGDMPPRVDLRDFYRRRRLDPSAKMTPGEVAVWFDLSPEMRRSIAMREGHLDNDYEESLAISEAHERAWLEDQFLYEMSWKQEIAGAA